MAPANNKEKKKHHFIPIVALKNFVDSDGYLHFWYRKNNPRKIDRQKPTEIFYAKHLYSFERDGKVRDNRLEDFYGDKIETPAGVLFEAIFPELRAGKVPRLSPEQRSTLLHFWYYQIKRTPGHANALMDNAGTEGFVERTLDEAANQGKLAHAEKPTIKSRMMRNIRVTAQARKPSEQVWNFLNELGLCFYRIKTPNKSFVLGDAPGALAGIPGITGSLPVPFLPLASDIAMGFLGRTSDITLYDLPTNAIRALNEATTARSTIVAGKSPTLVSSLAQAVPFRGVTVG